MQARITAIFHNCFFVQVDGHTLLFDYPARNYLPEAAAQTAASLLADRDLTVFVSHSHDDHFDPDILTATSGARHRRFVVSDDVADLHGDRLPQDAVVMEPDSQCQIDAITVVALESNDLGVAYRIEVGGLSIYFGGDLALWDWPGHSAAAHRAVGMSWRRTLKRLGEHPLDIAFSNMDPRLESLAGAPDFVATLSPRLFVPMHLGGHTEYIDRVADRLTAPGTALFRYAKPGDALEWTGGDTPGILAR